MTTFINLESYLDCCRYAHLFGEDPQQYIPPQSALPTAYKQFYRTYENHGFVSPSAIATQAPSQLALREAPIALNYMGLTLEDGAAHQIFIVREANALVLRSLQERYLYANVFYYWCCAAEITQQIALHEKLVIYNLDDFTTDQITPLTFENHRHSPYPIPVVDMRSLAQYESLKIADSQEKIAQKVGQSLPFADFDHGLIEDYLKQIHILKLMASQTQGQSNFGGRSNISPSEKIELIIKLENHFFTANLGIQEVEAIILECLGPWQQALNAARNKNSDCRFVLLGHYVQFPGVKERLMASFGEDVLFPEINLEQFSTI